VTETAIRVRGQRLPNVIRRRHHQGSCLTHGSRIGFAAIKTKCEGSLDSSTTSTSGPALTVVAVLAFSVPFFTRHADRERARHGVDPGLPFTGRSMGKARVPLQDAIKHRHLFRVS